jgi:hypothetical protein
LATVPEQMSMQGRKEERKVCARHCDFYLGLALSRSWPFSYRPPFPRPILTLPSFTHTLCTTKCTSISILPLSHLRKRSNLGPVTNPIYHQIKWISLALNHPKSLVILVCQSFPPPNSKYCYIVNFTMVTTVEVKLC